MKEALTQKRLCEVLSYDAGTGEFRWLVASGSAKAGDLAGTIDKRTGYLRIRVDGGRYRAHRLALLYVTGVWPSQLVDHENGDRLDNTYKNLRECSPGQNSRNTKPRRSKTGVRGVKRTRYGTYEARIGVNGKQVFLGGFKNMRDAGLAYDQAALTLHGPFVRAPSPQFS